MAAGDIALAIGSRGNTLSSNLNVLKAAGLIASRREGRSIIYTAVFEQMGDLLTYLEHDCFGGDFVLCGPALARPVKGS